MNEDEEVSDVMKLSGSERVTISVRMFEEFRKQIIASMPNDLPPAELQHRLFERVYGAKIEELVKVVRIGPER
jgi:hypothetical protein